MASHELEVTIERWPIVSGFTIARGSKSVAEVVVATILDGVNRGRGECVPYPRYGESLEGVRRAIAAMRQAIGGGMTRAELQQAMAPGAARNAIDCALWDLEAKRKSMPAAELAGVGVLCPTATAYTISLGTAHEMAEAARVKRHYRLLKLKLGAEGDEDRLEAVRQARPDARLIVDANEGWPANRLEQLLGAAAAAGVELVEQPLASDSDAHLGGIKHTCPVCADESIHDRSTLGAIAGRYDAINVKLDKTGGLTEALALIEEARAAGLKIMVGCMVSTSLAIAPALIAASQADYVDLDGPLLLVRDRKPGLTYGKDVIAPPPPELWG